VSQSHSTMEAAVKTCVDGLYEGEAGKLGAAFHPSADLRWVENRAFSIRHLQGVLTRSGHQKRKFPCLP
jgi:hypothetical protein